MTINGQNVVESGPKLNETENCGVECKRKSDVDEQCTSDNSLEKRVEESLSACKIIKNVIKTRLEMRKRQGDKQKLCERKVAQKLLKKQKQRVQKKILSKNDNNHIVIDLNLNVM